jgi:hypothetical protein
VLKCSVSAAQVSSENGYDPQCAATQRADGHVFERKRTTGVSIDAQCAFNGGFKSVIHATVYAILNWIFGSHDWVAHNRCATPHVSDAINYSDFTLEDVTAGPIAD